MQTGWIRVQAALATAVLASGIAATVVSSGAATATPQATGRVLALVQRAPLALKAYPTVKMTLTFTVDVNGHHLGFTETGLISRDGHVGTLHMNLPNDIGALDAVVVGTTVYARVVASKVNLTGGRHWAAVTITGGQSQPVTGSNALDYLRLLAGADGRITTVGASSVDGTPCTHYRVDVDVAKAAAATPPQFGGGGQQLINAGIRTLPVDVWLDNTGAPRQMKMHYSLDGGRVAMTFRFRGSNQPVHVTAPSASDVYPVSDFQQLAQFIVNVP